MILQSLTEKHLRMQLPGSKLVSVIMPAYNAEKFISEAISSVLNQTYSNIELIIVNDGSTDNTMEVVDRFSRDKRVVVITQPNAGCSGAKNTGLNAARGEFIQYLDADDILSANKIEEQVRVLEIYPMKVAVCRTKCFDKQVTEPGVEIDTDKLGNYDKPLEFLLNLYGLNGTRGMVQPNAFLVSDRLAKEAGPWDMSISPSPDEDGEYFCRLILKSAGIVFTPGGVNYYRKQDGENSSLSKQHSAIHVRGALRSLELKHQHLQAFENSLSVRQVIAGQYAEFVYMYSASYPQLADIAFDNMKKLGNSHLIASGGKTFRLLAGIIGFRNAIRLKNIFSAKEIKPYSI